MRFHWDFGDNLLIEANTTGFTAHIRKQVVVIPFAPADPAAMQIKGYTRHQDKVQSV